MFIKGTFQSNKSYVDKLRELNSELESQMWAFQETTFKLTTENDKLSEKIKHLEDQNLKLTQECKQLMQDKDLLYKNMQELEFEKEDIIKKGEHSVKIIDEKLNKWTKKLLDLEDENKALKSKNRPIEDRCLSDHSCLSFRGSSPEKKCAKRFSSKPAGICQRSIWDIRNRQFLFKAERNSKFPKIL